VSNTFVNGCIKSGGKAVCIKEAFEHVADTQSACGTKNERVRDTEAAQEGLGLILRPHHHAGMSSAEPAKQ